MTKEENEEENKDRARLWLLGQRIARQNFNSEAYTRYWNEKRAQEEREREEEKNDETK